MVDASLPSHGNSYHATRILDGTRVSDGKYGTLKLVDKTYHPHETDIGRYFSSQPLATSANHRVPIYDVFPVPDEESRMIIVMPLLQEYLRPSFDTIGEVVECFRQLFEGLLFMHKHRIAHWIILMDLMRRDFYGYARYKTRTERPPKYLFIDFGLSRRYDPSIAGPLEVPVFQKSNGPCDPFPTDILYIGNAIRKDFVERPFNSPWAMDEVVQRFAAISAGQEKKHIIE